MQQMYFILMYAKTLLIVFIYSVISLFYLKQIGGIFAIK